MAVQTLDPNLLVPAALHDPRQPEGVLAVTLVDLHRQRRFGMACIDADDRQAECVQLRPQPGCRRTRLETDAHRPRRLRSYEAGDRFRVRDHSALAQHRACRIHHTDRCLPEGDVQANVSFHSCSPVFIAPGPAHARPRVDGGEQYPAPVGANQSRNYSMLNTGARRSECPARSPRHQGRTRVRAPRPAPLPARRGSWWSSVCGQSLPDRAVGALARGRGGKPECPSPPQQSAGAPPERGRAVEWWTPRKAAISLMRRGCRRD